MITFNEFTNLAKINSKQTASALSAPPLNLNSSLLQQPLKTDTFEKQQDTKEIDIIKDRKKKILKRFIIEAGVVALALLAIKNGKKIFNALKNVVENYKTDKIICEAEIIPAPDKSSSNPPIRRALTYPAIIDVEGYSIN